jgi:hypothetical protein
MRWWPSGCSCSRSAFGTRSRMSARAPEATAARTRTQRGSLITHQRGESNERAGQRGAAGGERGERREREAREPEARGATAVRRACERSLTRRKLARRTTFRCPKDAHLWWGDERVGFGEYGARTLAERRAARVAARRLSVSRQARDGRQTRTPLTERPDSRGATYNNSLCKSTLVVHSTRWHSIRLGIRSGKQ